MIKKKIQKLLIPLVILTTLNLLIGIKAFAGQQVNVSINSGSLYPQPIVPLNFNRTILSPNSSTQTSIVLNPSSPSATSPEEQIGKIMVTDQAIGDTFRVDLSLQNLVDNTNPVTPSIIRYDNFKILTFTQNQTESVDSGSANNPAGTNDVFAPLDYKPPSNNYNDIVNNPDQINDANFTNGIFPLDMDDPNPNDAGSESRPVTIMQRTIPGTFPNIGTYSAGMVLRANVPLGTTGGDYRSQLTLSFYEPNP